MATIKKGTLSRYGFHRGPHLTKAWKRNVAKAERRAAQNLIRKSLDKPE